MGKPRIAGRAKTQSDNPLQAFSGGLSPRRCGSCQRLERRIASLSILFGYVFVSCLSDDEALAFARQAELNVEGFLRGRRAGSDETSQRQRALRDALEKVKT
jgi:hypothetical protein